MKKGRHPFFYFYAIARGLALTMKHFFYRTFTIQYPEENKPLAERYRGEHKLTKNDKGETKCVACFLCATACPSHCIFIEGDESTYDDEGRFKVPKRFEIDMLRCIYCGYCVEACPEDAIIMTNKIPRVYSDRKKYIYDMKKLLDN